MADGIYRILLLYSKGLLRVTHNAFPVSVAFSSYLPDGRLMMSRPGWPSLAPSQTGGLLSRGLTQREEGGHSAATISTHPTS